ncbi:MAG: family 1 glycosylhydrolase [Oscillospiraceae bacterium]|nr:family 1 glycosylhydrolase [Oscillospiraceae bacterium]
MGFKLNIKLGVATSATQIEGGNLDSSWNDWYAKGKIKDNSNPSRANDHYNLWKDDIKLMKSMGIEVYRFGIEWARIEPKEGVIDKEAIEHYRSLITEIKSNGILPLLTIHHFTNPMWFEKKGGFKNKDNIEIFLNYVKICVENFGDLISEYLTINEPNVYATHAYFYGLWPPGEKSFFSTINVYSVMAVCHIKAYELIHRMRKEMGYKDTKVSFANHMRVFAPVNPKNLIHKSSTKLTEWLFQSLMNSAYYKGEFKFPLKNFEDVKKGDYCDFVALNYYSRSTIKYIGDGTLKGAPVNDLGWEIYPNGLVECAQELYDICKKPIYVTENGTCDLNDSFRSLYIYDHLKAICESSLPFERYYHWCFCDNFEWIEGEEAKFGLVSVDYDTQKRRIKKSGEFYSKVIENGGVTDSIYDEYVKGEKYHN